MMVINERSSTLEDYATDYLESGYDGEFSVDAELDHSEGAGEIIIEFDGEKEYPDLGQFPLYMIGELGLEEPEIFSITQEKEGIYIGRVKGSDRSSY